MKLLGKKLLLAAFSVVIVCIVAEVGLRVFVEQEVKRLAIYDRELGWRGRPHGKGAYVRKHDGIRVPFRYNNYGFNDDDIESKSDGGMRVVMLGDSFVESLEVPSEAIFHQLVQTQLRSAFDERSDVVALCSQGYSTAQELLAFRKYRNLVDGDIALLVFYEGNDFEDNLRTQFAYLTDEGELMLPENTDSWARGQYLGLKRWLYESSHLVFVAKNVLESYTSLQLGDSSKEATEESEAHKLSITQKLVVACKDEVEAAGLEFGVVIIPDTAEIRGEVEQDRTSSISEFCQAANIRHIDLSKVLTPDDYFAVDFHFNESGHQKTADAIMQMLRDDFGIGVSSESASDLR